MVSPARQGYAAFRVAEDPGEPEGVCGETKWMSGGHRAEGDTFLRCPHLINALTLHRPANRVVGQHVSFFMMIKGSDLLLQPPCVPSPSPPPHEVLYFGNPTILLSTYSSLHSTQPPNSFPLLRAHFPTEHPHPITSHGISTEFLGSPTATQLAPMRRQGVPGK